MYFFLSQSHFDTRAILTVFHLLKGLPDLCVCCGSLLKNLLKVARKKIENARLCCLHVCLSGVYEAETGSQDDILMVRMARLFMWL